MADQYNDELTLTVGGDVLTIGVPDISNRFNYNNGQVQLQNISGESIFLHQSYWPEKYKLSYKFTNLSVVKSESIQAYILTYMGQETALVNHHSETWVGIVTNPLEVIQYIGIDRTVVSIEFEGILQ